MDDRTPERAGTKAGRNEQRKVLAALLNTLSAAALLLGLLQPALALISGSRPLGLRDAVATLVFCALAFILHVGAQSIASRVED